MNKLDSIVLDHIAVIEKLNSTSSDLICSIAEIVIKRLKLGSKLIFMGNGGSASDSQHLSAEFVGRFVNERQALAAISLSTDTSALTAIGNDYGFDKIFERQINGLAKKGDVVFGITTSGNSPNVLKAIQAAKKLDCITIGLTGQDGGKLKDFCDETIIVPSNVTARIQEAHILIGHILCDIVDTAFD
jgi:D-sedoheptulose 7-phosphate isomerase